MKQMQQSQHEECLQLLQKCFLPEKPRPKTNPINDVVSYDNLWSQMLSFRSVASSWIPLSKLSYLEQLRTKLSNDINGLADAKQCTMKNIRKMLSNNRIELVDDRSITTDSEYFNLIESVRGLFADDKEVMNSEGLIKQSIIPELKNLGLGYCVNVSSALKLLNYRNTFSQLDLSIDDGPETDLSPNLSVNRLESIVMDGSSLQIDVDEEEKAEFKEKDDILVRCVAIIFFIELY